MKQPIANAPHEKTHIVPKRSKFASNLRQVKKEWQLYSLLVLPVIYLLLFKYIPMMGNVIAFRRYAPGGSVFGEEWVGMRYIEMFIQSSKFWEVFMNNIMLGSVTLLVGFPAPIILALLLNELRSKRFKKFVQSTSYLPHFLSIVIVSGMIFQITAEDGPINAIIRFFGGETILFMQQADWFLPIYVLSDLWQTVGWGTILYLAALTGIDESLYEAAKIDGANKWKQTLHITLPGITPIIVVLLTLNIGKFMQVGFEKVLLLYNPLIFETADVISTYLFRVGLQSGNFSYATAIGLFEALIGLVLVFSANYLSKKITGASLW
ncbi:ABC transporter permease [Aureibacillus halotolerans]|nr:ABC transporter permease subunit [Aureibacillus halotolerans]